MIENQIEYKIYLKRIDADRRFADSQRKELESRGLTADEVDRAMEPLISFHAKFEEEVALYEKKKSIKTVFCNAVHSVLPT